MFGGMQDFKVRSVKLEDLSMIEELEAKSM